MEKKLIPIEIYFRNHEICCKKVSLSVSKTNGGVFLAQKKRYVVPSIGTNQIIIYRHIPAPMANGTLNLNILSIERRVHPLWLPEYERNRLTGRESRALTEEKCKRG